MKVKLLSHVRFFVTPWTAAHQAPPSMGFSRQEYWRGMPLPSLGHLFRLTLFNCAAGREEHCKQISLERVGSAHSVWVTLGLPPLTVWALSGSILLRLQVALQGNCLRWALACVHFPGISHSGSGSWVLHKGTDSVRPAFCALPRSEQLRRPGAWRAYAPQVGQCILSPLPSQVLSFLVCSGRAISGVMCVSSGELIFACDPPGRCQPSRIPGILLSNWEPARSLVEDAISGAEFAPCLPAMAVSAFGGAWANPQLAGSPLVFAQSFVL